MADDHVHTVDLSDEARGPDGHGASRTTWVLQEIAAERAAQDAQWGQQNHPDGTGMEFDRGVPDLVRDHCERAFAAGEGTWRHILAEETAEAYAERDPERLREELVQVAAVAVAWVEAIDRRAVQPDQEVEITERQIDAYIDSFVNTGDRDDPAYRERVRRFLQDNAPSAVQPDQEADHGLG